MDQARTSNRRPGALALRGLALSLLAATLAAGSAHAQERPPINGHAFLPEDRWGRLTEADVGQRFYLDGRWHQVYGEELHLHKPPRELRGFLAVLPRRPLQESLSANRASDNQRLEPRQSSIRLFGEAQGVGQGATRRVFLQVARVEKLPEEAQTFRARLAQLGDDADMIRALGRECAGLAERYEDARLAEVTHEITRRELAVRRAELAAADHPGRMRLAERYRAEVDDDREAIALYAEVIEAGRVTDAARRRAGEALQDLRAVRTRTRSDVGEVAWTWVPYDDFKTSEGFIRRTTAGKTAWIQRELAELQDAIAEESARQRGRVDPPRLDPRKALEDARARRISRGQNLVEVRRAAGLPARVNHTFAAYDTNKDSVWTQWLLADGRRVYFVNGEVISFKAHDQPWPDR